MSVVIINFKTYERGTGSQAIELAKICEEFGAWAAVQALDLRSVCQAVQSPVLAQHVDDVSYGKHTGAIMAQAVKQAGAKGALINHSEKRISHEEIGKRVTICSELGLTSVVCAASVEEAESYLEFEPDYIAVELPELIGGDVSVVTADPELVKKAVERLGSNVLMGAGVNSAADLKKSLEDGVAGVILSSAVVQKADNPRDKLAEIYSA